MAFDFDFDASFNYLACKFRVHCGFRYLSNACGNI